jgi:hypothetical protein
MTINTAREVSTTEAAAISGYKRQSIIWAFHRGYISGRRIGYIIILDAASVLEYAAKMREAGKKRHIRHDYIKQQPAEKDAA